MQDPQAPRTQAGASPRHLADIRSPYSSSRPLSPNAGGIKQTAAGSQAATRPHSPAHGNLKARTTALLGQAVPAQRHTNQQAGEQQRQQALLRGVSVMGI